MGSGHNRCMYVTRLKKYITVKPASQQIIINWIDATISHLKSRPDMIKMSFMVTGIGRSLDGSDDNKIRSIEVETEIAKAYNEDESEGEESTIEDIADNEENSEAEIDTDIGDNMIL